MARRVRAPKTDKVETTEKTKGDTKQMKTAPPVKTTPPMKTIGTAISRTVNLGNFESAKIEISITECIKADTDINKALDALFDLAEMKLDEKLEKYEDLAVTDEPADSHFPGNTTDDEDPDDEDPADEDLADEDPDGEDPDGEDEVTEEEIMVMKKKELIQLITDERIEDDVDPKEFKKIGDLRQAVIDAIFEEDPADEDPDAEGGEWDDDEWED